MEFLNYSSIPPLISSILFILIGLTVYSNNKKSSLNKSFFALCIATFIWQFTMFLLFNTTEPSLAGVLVKIAHVGIIFLPVFIYHFSLSLNKKKNNIDNLFLVTNYVMAIFFELLLFTDLFINGYYEYFWSFYPKAGIFHPVYLFLLAATFLRTQYNFLINFYSKKDSPDKLYYQVKYIFWAIIFYSLASFDFLLNYGVELYPIGFVFILIFMLITAYAIIKHRFMDIKIVLRQSSVYILSFLILAILASILSIFNKSDGSAFYIINIIITVSLAIAFPFIKNYLIKLANKYFFTSLYDYRQIINDLSQKLRTTLELKYVYEYVFNSINTTFHPSSFGFLILDSEENLFKFKYRKGAFKYLPQEFKSSAKIQKYYINKNKVIIPSELKNTKDKDFVKIGNNLSTLGIEIIIPVNIKWRNIGAIALGKKETKDIYNSNDIEVLEIIAGLSASAIENGYLYKNIKQKKLKLEKLLQVKNDFLKIVNHQLNTPLSIMKLAFNSIDEKVLDTEEGFLIAKEGLNRMSDVIFQIWTVFDIENDRFTLNLEDVNIYKVLEELIKEKKETRQVLEKELKINLIASKDIINETVKTDQLKIKNVISGLIDNAIFYTKKGVIEIKIDYEDIKGSSYLKISISDTGVGIDEKDQKLIFEKFYRGKDAVLLHPDGSGLGLFVAKHIIEASQGNFSLEKSTIQEGSVFTFTLPLSQKQ